MRKNLDTKWRRQLLPYNVHFQGDAAEVRRRLHVPNNGMNPKEALDWRREHCQAWATKVAHHYGFELETRWVDVDEPTPTVIGPKITMEEWNRLSDAQRKAELYPLRRYTQRLLSAYGLDEEIRAQVEMFILTTHPSFLFVAGITPSPSFTPLYFAPTVDRDAVRVFHLGPNTTREQWIALWPDVKKLLEERYGSRSKQPRKRTALSRQLVWWQLSKQGKNPHQIADELSQPVTDDAVRAGIEEIEGFMRPLRPPLPTYNFL